MCKSSNGAHCLHMAAPQKDPTAIRQIVNALMQVHGVKKDEIAKWINWTNAKGLSVRDIAAYSDDIHRVVREFGGQFAIEKPTALEQPRIPPDHNWNRQKYGK